ncbi:MAG TPA: IS1595 family transposase [Bryobacteraceae bacterium]|nr:IS1595 family transposase [Bryobacteraceae bacterium]
MSEVKGEINLCALIERFGSEQKCRRYLEKLRWPEGAVCPRCQSQSISRVFERDQFDCNSCRYQFSVTAGSIFHDSHLPIWKWFLATYMMIESKKGISANQLKRTLSVSYKTAWYLCHRIRRAMLEMRRELLSGTVECDEIYIGGRRRHVGSEYVDNKTKVLGALQPGGEIRLRVEKRSKKATKEGLHQSIKETTDPATQRIMTDECPGYKGIADADTKYEAVKHRLEEWVRGDVHTNSMEGVWSLFKRSIVGSYHQVSAKHLDAYLDEFEWRFNQRENPYLFRDTLIRLLRSPRIEFKKLIEKTA